MCLSHLSPSATPAIVVSNVCKDKYTSTCTRTLTSLDAPIKQNLKKDEIREHPPLHLSLETIKSIHCFLFLFVRLPSRRNPLPHKPGKNSRPKKEFGLRLWSNGEEQEELRQLVFSRPIAASLSARRPHQLEAIRCVGSGRILPWLPSRNHRENFFDFFFSNALLEEETKLVIFVPCHMYEGRGQEKEIITGSSRDKKNEIRDLHEDRYKSVEKKQQMKEKRGK